MPRSATELATFLNAELHGDGHHVISGVAAPERAGPQDLIYVDSDRYLDAARASAAMCVICAGGTSLPGRTLLTVAQPKLAFAKAAGWLLPAPQIAKGVHHTAIIDPTAQLGANVAIGPYAVIEAGARIGAGTQIGAHSIIGTNCVLGENCRVHPRVTLYSGARLGHRVVVHSGAVIGKEGFGYVFGEGRFWPFPQVGTIELEDDVEVGANVTIDRGSLGHTRIARGTKLDNLVHVAHNVQIGEHCVVAAQTGISGSSTVGKNVLVGGQVGIADNCEIEDGAVLGAQAGIPTGKTIRKGQVVWGTPARPLERFKEQYAWFARLPELAARLRALETKVAAEERK